MTRTPLTVEVSAAAMYHLSVLSLSHPVVAQTVDRLIEKMQEGSLEAFYARSLPVSDKAPDIRTINRAIIQLTVRVSGDCVLILTAGLMAPDAFVAISPPES